MRKLFCLACILFWHTSISFATVLLLEDPPTKLSLSDYIFITTPAISYHSIEELFTNNASATFVPLSENTINSPTSEPVWIKFEVKNLTESDIADTEYVLHLSLTFTNIEVYTVDNDENVIVHKSGFFTPITERSYVPALKGNYIKLSLQPNKSYTIYAKLICERTAIAPEFELTITNFKQFQKTLINKQRWNALYIGFILMMLLYNLLIFLFAKDRAFLFYAIYLAGIVLYTAYNSSDLADLITPYLFPNSPYLIYYFKLLIYPCIASYLFFLRSFLNLKNALPVCDTLLKWTAILALPSLVLDGTIMTATNFSYNISDGVLITYVVVFVFASFSIIPSLLKSTDHKRHFIIYGVLAMGIGTLLTTWERLQSIDFSTFYFRIGSIIEIILFSLGLAFRHLQQEKKQQKVYYELEKSKLIQQQEQIELQRIKEIDQLKTKLYTNITHEFRTPLTVIMGMADTIKGNKKIKELIIRNSTNLLSLINQLLDLAQAEKGQLKLTPKSIELIQYLRYLIESFSTLAATKNIRLHFNTSFQTLPLSIDEEKLKHILQNLISNAIKFTPQYGVINISVNTILKDGEEILQITVQDSGSGIAEKDLPHVFERFYQKNTSTTSGTGIGLSIAKEFVELMNGTIKVSSQLYKGSKFTILLPLKRLDSEPAVVPITLQKTEPPYLIGAQKVEYIPNKKPIILVIEDNMDVFIYIQYCLEKEYNLHLAQNGTTGIDMAQELIPDIIICDVMMPKKNGFEVTTTLKKNEKTSHIPIILLTAKVAQADKLKGLQAGANAYLSKPFDKKELLIRLNKIMEMRNHLQAYYSATDFNEPIPHSAGTQAELAFLEKLNEFIEKNLIEADFSMANLSAFLNMSQVQVYRKIKSLTNQTPTQYIRAKRLDKAVNLLKTTSLNISEIAYQVGYSDPNYFSRTFHKEFGRTPSSFR